MFFLVVARQRAWRNASSDLMVLEASSSGPLYTALTRVDNAEVLDPTKGTASRYGTLAVLFYVVK